MFMICSFASESFSKIKDFLDFCCGIIFKVKSVNNFYFIFSPCSGVFAFCKEVSGSFCTIGIRCPAVTVIIGFVFGLSSNNAVFKTDKFGGICRIGFAVFDYCITFKCSGNENCVCNFIAIVIRNNGIEIFGGIRFTGGSVNLNIFNNDDGFTLGIIFTVNSIVISLTFCSMDGKNEFVTVRKSFFNITGYVIVFRRISYVCFVIFDKNIGKNKFGSFVMVSFISVPSCKNFFDFAFDYAEHFCFFGIICKCNNNFCCCAFKRSNFVISVYCFKNNVYGNIFHAHVFGKCCGCYGKGSFDFNFGYRNNFLNCFIKSCIAAGDYSIFANRPVIFSVNKIFILNGIRVFNYRIIYPGFGKTIFKCYAFSLEHYKCICGTLLYPSALNKERKVSCHCSESNINFMNIFYKIHYFCINLLTIACKICGFGCCLAVIINYLNKVEFSFFRKLVIKRVNSRFDFFSKIQIKARTVGNTIICIFYKFFFQSECKNTKVVFLSFYNFKKLNAFLDIFYSIKKFFLFFRSNFCFININNFYGESFFTIFIFAFAASDGYFFFNLLANFDKSGGCFPAVGIQSCNYFFVNVNRNGFFGKYVFDCFVSRKVTGFQNCFFCVVKFIVICNNRTYRNRNFFCRECSKNKARNIGKGKYQCKEHCQTTRQNRCFSFHHISSCDLVCENTYTSGRFAFPKKGRNTSHNYTLLVYHTFI